MTNREKFKEEICNIAITGERLAVDKRNSEPCTCLNIGCVDCIAKGVNCRNAIIEWANSEYVEPCPFEKDELVEVSDDGKCWKLRYFSHMEENKPKYVVFMSGLKSTETEYELCYNYCRKYGTLGGLVKEQKQ